MGRIPYEEPFNDSILRSEEGAPATHWPTEDHHRMLEMQTGRLIPIWLANGIRPAFEKRRILREQLLG
jgi:hypothetical protein